VLGSLSSPESELANSPSSTAEPAALLLKAAFSDSYAHLCASALIRVRKLRPTLSPNEQMTLADNAVHDAYLRVIERADRYDPSRRPLAWIMGFVQKVIQESVRPSSEQQILYESSFDTDEWEWLKQKFSRNDSPSPMAEWQRNLDQAMATLEEEQRQIIELSAIQGQTAEQVALKLGLSGAGAARVAKHRAMTALKAVAQRLSAEGRD
jgi:RNA polymerase sigma factor (sigma-70 family)